MTNAWKTAIGSFRAACAGLVLLALPGSVVAQSSDSDTMPAPSAQSEITFTSWTGPVNRRVKMGQIAV